MLSKCSRALQFGIAFSIFVALEASNDPSRLFITDQDAVTKIQRTALTEPIGPIITDDYSQYSTATAIDVDAVAQRIYFAANQKIFTTDLNGIASRVFRENEGFSMITALALDRDAGLVYIADYGVQQIQKAWLGETSSTSAVIEFQDMAPLDMEIDLSNSSQKYLYWSDDLKKAIRRSNVDGSNILDVATCTFGNTRTPSFHGIGLDPINGHVYFTDGNAIRRSSLGSTADDQCTQIVTDSRFTSLKDLEVDSENTKLYFLNYGVSGTDGGYGTVWSVNFDGTGLTQVVSSTHALRIKNPLGLTLYHPFPAVTPTYIDYKDTATVPAAFSLIEGSLVQQYRLTLDSVPTANVNITLSTSDDGTLHLSPLNVTFTPNTWDVPQLISVRALPNYVRHVGSKAVNITHACRSTDSNYAFKSVPNVTVSIFDNHKRKIFWTDRNLKTVSRSNLDGTGMEVLQSGSHLGQPIGIFAEPLRQELYWVDKGSNPLPATIQVGDFGGYVNDTLVSMGVGTSYPSDIVMSPGRREIFWSDIKLDNAKISRLSVSGFIGTSLTVGTASVSIASDLGKPRSIVLDEVEDILYWIDGAGRTINFASIPASGQQAAITPLIGLSGANALYGLAFHRTRRRLYYADSSSVAPKIGYVDIDASLAKPYASRSPTVILTQTSGLNQPVDIAVDYLHERVYWVEYSSYMRSCDLEGGAVTTVLELGSSSRPNGIALFLDLPGVTLNRSSTVNSTGVDGYQHETPGEKRLWIANMTIRENTTEEYSVVLDNQPMADVTVSLSQIHQAPCVFASTCEMMNVGGVDVAQGDHSLLHFSPPHVVFNETNWNRPQIIRVLAVDDFVAQGDRAVQLIHEVKSDDKKYTMDNMATMTVLVAEDDTYGIEPNVDAITMLESRSKNFSIKLTSRPYSDVTIDVEHKPVNAPPDAQPRENGDHSKVQFEPARLVFTSDNWNKSQYVNVTAIDDLIDQGQRISHIAFDGHSRDSRYNKSDAAFNKVELTINEDDKASVTLSIERGSGSINTGDLPHGHPLLPLLVRAQEYGGCMKKLPSCNPRHENCGDGMRPSPAYNLLGGNEVFKSELTHYYYYPNGTFDCTNMSIPIAERSRHCDDAAQCRQETAMQAAKVDGNLGKFRVELDTVPYDAVTVNVILDDATQAFVQPSQLVFHGSTSYGSDLQAAIDDRRQQAVYVFAQDDYVQEDLMNVTVYFRVLSADTQYHGIVAPNLTAEVRDNDLAKISTNASQINVTEGMVTVFEVNLETKPSHGCETTCLPGEVTVHVHRFVHPDDHSRMVINASTLVFTDTDWDVPQVVRVLAVDDHIEQFDRWSVLHHSAGSLDPFYNLANSHKGLLPLRELQFTDAEIYQPNENAYMTEAHVVWVYVKEDDVAGVTVNVTHVEVEECEDRFNAGEENPDGSFIGGLANCARSMLAFYTIVLDTRPYAPVTLDLYVGNGEDMQAAKDAMKVCHAPGGNRPLSCNSQLLFDGDMKCTRGHGCGNGTAGDWDQPKTLMVVPADNNVNDGARLVNITGLASSNDTCSVRPRAGCRKSKYHRYKHQHINQTIKEDGSVDGRLVGEEMRGAAVPVIPVTIHDNEVEAVTIVYEDQPLSKGYYHPEPQDLTYNVQEGTTKYYLIKLSIEPNYPVAVKPIVSDTYQLTVSPEVINFHSGNYWQDQKIAVTANPNFVHDFDRNATITHEVNTSEVGEAVCTSNENKEGVFYLNPDAPCNTSYKSVKVGVVSLEIIDDDKSGVVISMNKAQMVEGGTTSFTVVLNSQPTHDVSIDIQPELLLANAETNCAAGATEEECKQVELFPRSLSFTEEDWKYEKRVMLNAADNDQFEGFTSRLTNLSFLSKSADANYHYIGISEVSVNITDDDAGCKGANSTQSGQYHCSGHGTCTDVLVRETSPGIFELPERPPTNSKFVYENPFLSGRVCQCEKTWGGRDCSVDNSQFERVDILLEAFHGFDVTFQDGRTWAQLASALQVPEQELYILSVEDSHCIFSWKEKCVLVTLDLLKGSKDKELLSMVRMKDKAVRHLNIKDIHRIENKMATGLLIGRDLPITVGIGGTLLMFWIGGAFCCGCMKRHNMKFSLCSRKQRRKG